MGPGFAIQGQGHNQHLIKVAIVDEAFVVNTQQRTAHHGFQVFRSIAVAQDIHILMIQSFRQQHAAETADGHIRDGE